MENKKYNGWTNYETWRVMLEFFDGYETDEKVSSEYCEEMLEDVLSNEGANVESLTFSYAMAFLSNVNYYEIADNINQNNDLTDEK